MVALELQQFQYGLKKNFAQRLRRLVFPMLFGASDGRNCQKGVDFKEGVRHIQKLMAAS
jgi:hypothetical protein